MLPAVAVSGRLSSSPHLCQGLTCLASASSQTLPESLCPFSVISVPPPTLDSPYGELQSQTKLKLSWFLSYKMGFHWAQVTSP